MRSSEVTWSDTVLVNSGIGMSYLTYDGVANNTLVQRILLALKIITFIRNKAGITPRFLK